MSGTNWDYRTRCRPAADEPDGAPRGCQWANGAATLTSACLPAQPHVGAFPFPVRSSNDERRTIQRFLALEP